MSKANPPHRGTLRRGAATRSAAHVAGKALRKASRKPVSERSLLDVASQLFAERGYAAISIRNIAASASVNFPSIYSRFNDKEDLYDRCCEHVWTEASVPLSEALGGSDPARVRVRRFVRALCAMLLKSEALSRLLQWEILLSQSKRIEVLTQRHFTTEYTQLVSTVASLSGTSGTMAQELAISIYALAFGLIALRPIFEIDGMGSLPFDDTDRLADLVFDGLFPDQSLSGE